jgi:hypothetical protein
VQFRNFAGAASIQSLRLRRYRPENIRHSCPLVRLKTDLLEQLPEVRGVMTPFGDPVNHESKPDDKPQCQDCPGASPLLRKKCHNIILESAREQSAPNAFPAKGRFPLPSPSVGTLAITSTRAAKTTVPKTPVASQTVSRLNLLIVSIVT